MARAWWKEAVVYQVYPSSFRDTNRDGWGDVKGIASRVDYLRDLGVDIVWVSPMYKSPHKDMGYDIADYKTIDPRYGTIDDVDELIVELKKRGMKLMMDLVANHTSDEHAWFLESRSSLDNPRRSWYIWKKPRRDKNGNPLPPNNWSQVLGEANSAWTYDSNTDEYFLSLFTSEQPDLNWENPEVRAAVHDVMHFWLQRGASGFRMDVINFISKDQRFPDAEPTLGPNAPYHPGHKYYINGPRMHEYLQEIKVKVLSKHDAITVGEMPEIQDIGEILRTVKSKTGELNMIFIFDIVGIDNQPESPRFTYRNWTAKDLASIITKWQQVMIKHDGWNSVFCENHDNPRSVSRYTDDSDEHRFYGSKLLALMQTTLSGTLFLYQGEELGMRNMPKEWDIETEYKDIQTVNFWKNVQNLYGHDKDYLASWRANIVKLARDHARTPVQWDDSPNAGFCENGIKPWMRVNDDYQIINAERQMNNQNPDALSVWQFWQRGLQNRKEHADVFIYGEFEPVEVDSESIFAYVRTGRKGGKWLVVLNFSGNVSTWMIPVNLYVNAWVAGSHSKGRVEKSLSGTMELRPWEGVLGECEG